MIKLDPVLPTGCLFCTDRPSHLTMLFHTTNQLVVRSAPPPCPSRLDVDYLSPFPLPPSLSPCPRKLARKSARSVLESQDSASDEEGATALNQPAFPGLEGRRSMAHASPPLSGGGGGGGGGSRFEALAGDGNDNSSAVARPRQRVGRAGTCSGCGGDFSYSRPCADKGCEVRS